MDPVLRSGTEILDSGGPCLIPEMSEMNASLQVVNGAALQRCLPYCRLDSGLPKVRLLCFAHAGGSALVFHKWPEKFPSMVQVCAVQLPGRERRLNEPFITRMPELMDEISRALLPWLDRPVALLGHSLGAKIAFEFARRVRAHPGAPEIAHLFVSGSRAPHMRSQEMPIYNLPDGKFLERLRSFGGTPQEILSDPDVMQFLVPRLRSDFELDDNYTFEPGERLRCPITAWAGDSDDLAPASVVESWAEHTTGTFHCRILKGSHFAFYKWESEVIMRVRQALSTYT
jgi:surfactin synthase thioesterase subunit